MRIKKSVIFYGWKNYENLTYEVKRHDLPIVHRLECIWNNPKLGQIASFQSGLEEMANATFCTYQGSDICDHDKGSGVFVKIQGKYYLRGIVSVAMNKPCGEEKEYFFVDIIANRYDIEERVEFYHKEIETNGDDISSMVNIDYSTSSFKSFTGTSILLSCGQIIISYFKIEEKPYAWYKDKVEISFDNFERGTIIKSTGGLYIKNLTLDDNGYYICVFKHGTHASLLFELQVENFYNESSKS